MIESIAEIVHEGIGLSSHAVDFGLGDSRVDPTERRERQGGERRFVRVIVSCKDPDLRTDCTLACRPVSYYLLPASVLGIVKIKGRIAVEPEYWLRDLGSVWVFKFGWRR